MDNMKNWDNIYRKKGKVQKRISKLVIKSVRLLKKNKVRKILDLGCGTGRHTIFLAKRGFKLYGTDISQKGLDFIKREAYKLKIKNVNLKRADMTKMPYKEGFFDAIVSISVINHAELNKIKKTFKEIERLLRKGGILVLRVVSPKDFTYRTGKEIEPWTRIGIADWDSSMPHHFFTKKEIKQFLKNFDILELKETSKMSERLKKIRHHYEIIAIKK